MAWPKLNAVAFWMIPVGAALIWLGFADTSWNAYPPYSIIRAPGPAARSRWRRTAAARER